MPVQSCDIHARSLEISTALSAYYVLNFIAPLEVFRVLNNAQVRFMLLGTHALGGWMQEPRTTTQVDILVGARSNERAVCILLSAFPQLCAEEKEEETRLWDAETGQALIDVMKPKRLLFRQALKHTLFVQSEGQGYRIPSLEMAIAMKFAAMISPTRNLADRYIDTHDFLCMIRSNSEIDSRKLHALGRFISTRGGDEIVDRVRRVQAGEKFTL